MDLISGKKGFKHIILRKNIFSKDWRSKIDEAMVILVSPPLYRILAPTATQKEAEESKKGKILRRQLQKDALDILRNDL